MKTTKGIITGAAIGLTVAIWVVAYLMIQHIPPSPEAPLPEQNVSASPTGAPSPEQKQDEAVKQQSDEKPQIREQSQTPQEQPKPLQPPPAESKKEASDNTSKYVVRLAIPSHMNGADILVDGKPAVMTEILPSFVTILVEQKNQPTKILLRKGEKTCEQTLLINRDINGLTPCK